MSLREQRNLVLDKGYFESAVFGLFQINIRNLVVNKVNLAKNFHIQPSEIDKMPMWEYEMFMDNLNEIIKKENEEQEKESKKYKDTHKMTNPSNLSKYTPKIPTIKMPKF